MPPALKTTTMPPVLLYTTPYCGFCLAAKRLLAKKGLDFEEIDVSFDGAKRAEMTARSGGGLTVPQVFIADRHVGGYMELVALERAGALDDWLAGAPQSEPGTEPAPS
jgi:glutaredoxin 3